ncbi:MAG: hypothetical protein RLZZ584_2723 [Pseudomonadota bacterium]
MQFSCLVSPAGNEGLNADIDVVVTPAGAVLIDSGAALCLGPGAGGRWFSQMVTSIIVPTQPCSRWNGKGARSASTADEAMPARPNPGERHGLLDLRHGVMQPPPNL